MSYKNVVETMKTLMIVQQKVGITYGGFDNLTLTAKALNADIFTKETIPSDLNNYQCCIIVDNVNYNVFNNIAIDIRKTYPDMLIGWHQEKEVDNIFKRHKCHYDMTSSEESWCISSLKVWNNVNVCDFIILHNSHDQSINFYSIFAPEIKMIISGPFLPIDEISQYYKHRTKKLHQIAFGFNFYDYRGGAFLGYLVAGQKKYNSFNLCIWAEANSSHSTDKMKETHEVIQKEFYQRKINIFYMQGSRINLAKFFADCYIVINLRKPTSGRTNAICAAVGTPMIGNEESSIQQKLFPDLCVNRLNLLKIDTLLHNLVNDINFYDYVVKIASENTSKVSIESCSKYLKENIERIWKQR